MRVLNAQMIMPDKSEEVTTYARRKMRLDLAEALVDSLESGKEYLVTVHETVLNVGPDQYVGQLQIRILEARFCLGCGTLILDGDDDVCDACRGEEDDYNDDQQMYRDLSHGNG